MMMTSGRRLAGGIAIILLMVGGASGPAEARESVQIAGLSQGLMHQTVMGAWRVYEPGRDFQFVPNGGCTAAGIHHDCLWYGVEFDYAAAAEGEILDCVAHFAQRSDVVTPREEKAAQTSEYHFRIVLPGVGGHLAYPAYVTGDLSGAEMRVDCSADGAPALQYAFRFAAI